MKSVSDAVGPSGVSPTMAVFGAAARHFPALHRDHAVVHTDRIRAMQSVRKAIERYQGSQSVKAAAKHCGPNPTEQDLSIGDDVLTFQKNIGWTGSHNLIALTHADAEVRDTKGVIALLERTRGKKYLPRTAGDQMLIDEYRNAVTGGEDIRVADGQSQSEDFPGDAVDYSHAFQSSSKSNGDTIFCNPDRPYDTENIFAFETNVFAQSQDNAERFAASRNVDITGLLDSNVFGVMKRSEEEASDNWIYKSQVVDSVKNYRTPQAVVKSLFVLRGYNDKEAQGLLRKAPTVRKNSTRVLLTLAASSPGHGIELRDISHAFTLSRTYVQRRVVCEAPVELGLSEGIVLVVIRPLYELPEAALHWYVTYSSFHKNDLRMTSTTSDPRLFFRHQQPSSSSVSLDCLVAVQVHDSLISGTADLLAEENVAVNHFQCKIAKIVVDGGEPIAFNRSELRKENEMFLAVDTSEIFEYRETASVEMFIRLRVSLHILLYGQGLNYWVVSSFWLLERLHHHLWTSRSCRAFLMTCAISKRDLDFSRWTSIPFASSVIRTRVLFRMPMI
jgi:hypothetical protein